MKNRKLWASILAGILAAVMLLSLLAGIMPRPVSAASSSEIKKQLDELKEERAEQKKQIADLKSQYKQNFEKIEDIVAQRQILDQEIFVLHDEIITTNNMIATYNVLIADMQEDLNEAEARLHTLNEQYKERVRAMEEEGSLSYWSVLFRASSFADFLDRINMILEIEAADMRRMEELKAASQAVAEAQAQLAEERAQLEVTKEELAAAQLELEAKQEKAEELLNQLIAKGDEYQALIDESEEADNALLEEIAKKEKEYKNQKYKEWLATSVPPTTKAPKPTGGSDGGAPTGSGSWRSPMTYPTYVTSPFGMRLHPVYKEWRMHKGVDLASRKNDTIVAVRSGVVTTAKYGSSSGYHVVINHGDGFSSSYLHMTHYIVSVGQKVSAGQVIGYVGSTGTSTGAHLHFSIYYNGATQNPSSYVKFY
jgi:murein DD-endopeptidase MepM/ murein hydrolase activator NlpD